MNSGSKSMNSGSSQKTVSAIVPTYNRGHLLGNAIESIEKQDYRSIEIVIVDDRSTDDTAAVIARLQRANAKILFSCNERSKGPSGARNTGLLRASGDYVSFLDSDDIWLEGHIKEGVDILENHPEIDVLFGNFEVADFRNKERLYEFFDEKKVLKSLRSVIIEPQVRLIRDDVFRALILENFFHLGSSICRRSAVEGILFDEDVTFGEDKDFAIRLFMEKRATLAYREEPVFVLYKHDSNLSADTLTRRQIETNSRILLFLKYLRIYPLGFPEKLLLHSLISSSLLDLAYLYRLDRKHTLALRQIVKSARYGISFSQLRELLKLVCFVVFKCGHLL